MNEQTDAGASPVQQEVMAGFAEWKALVDEIAAEEGLTPKESPLPGELEVWVRHFMAGKTPAQAWKAVPYRKRW